MHINKTDTVRLEGTVRTFSPAIQELIIQRLKEICEGIGIAFRAKINLEYKKGYPCTINHAPQAETLKKAAIKIVGEQRVSIPVKTTAAEDFSYFIEEKAGCFFFVGSTPGELPTKYPHHSPQFDIEERALLIASSVFVQLIDDTLCQ